MADILSDQVLVGLGPSMLPDGSYGAVRERLLQGLVYCTDTGYAQLCFPTSEEGGFFERPFNPFVPRPLSWEKSDYFIVYYM